MLSRLQFSDQLTPFAMLAFGPLSSSVAHILIQQIDVDSDSLQNFGFIFSVAMSVTYILLLDSNSSRRPTRDPSQFRPPHTRAHCLASWRPTTRSRTSGIPPPPGSIYVNKRGVEVSYCLEAGGSIAIISQKKNPESRRDVTFFSCA